MANSVAILTRFQAQNEEIVRCLDGTVMSVSMPLFCLLETDKKQEAIEILSSACEGDAVLFVSPSAAEFAKGLMPEFSRGAFLLGPGIATEERIRALWPEATLLANGASVEKSGSEVVADILIRAGIRRVFVARAQRGREFLSERLSAQGIEVRPVEVYRRLPAGMSNQIRTELCRVMKTTTPVLFITSSEAVGVLVKEALAVNGMLDWMQSGVVLTIHPRIETRLKEAGFSRVELVDSAAATVANRILSLCH